MCMYYQTIVVTGVSNDTQHQREIGKRDTERENIGYWPPAQSIYRAQQLRLMIVVSVHGLLPLETYFKGQLVKESEHKQGKRVHQYSVSVQRISHTHTHAHRHTCTQTHMHTCTDMHAHIHSHKGTHTHNIHKLVHTYAAVTAQRHTNQ